MVGRAVCFSVLLSAVVFAGGATERHALAAESVVSSETGCPADPGNAAGEFRLGVLFDLGLGVVQNWPAAAACYLRAAERGDRKAQFNIGAMYDYGRGVPRDRQKAAAWYRRAAEQGDGRGAYALGLMYEKGDGVAQNAREALHWYRAAATNGIAAARTKTSRLAAQLPAEQPRPGAAPPAEPTAGLADYRRGFAYLTGQGVARDSVLAFVWFSQAAKAGSDLGAYALAVLYERGDGIEKNDILAYAWYRIAAEAFPPGIGRTAARKGYTHVADRLTDPQRQQAKRRTHELRRAIEDERRHPGNTLSSQ